MKTLRLILVAILLAASPAAAACELLCAHATEARAQHHDDTCPGPASPEHAAGCCCISQSFATTEAAVHTVAQDTAALGTVPAPSAVPPRTTFSPTRQGGSLDERPPFTDRNRPLLL